MKPNVHLNMVTKGCYYDDVHDRCGCIWLLPVPEELCGNPEKCTVPRPADRYNIVMGMLTPTEIGQGCTNLTYPNGEHVPDHVLEYIHEKFLEHMDMERQKEKPIIGPGKMFKHNGHPVRQLVFVEGV